MLFGSCTSSHYIILLLVLSTGGRAKGNDDEGGSLSAEDFENAKHKDFSNEEVHDEDGSSSLFEGDIELTTDDRDALDRGIELREVVGGAHRKWPMKNGVVEVPYTIPSGLSSERKTTIARAIQEFRDKTCIRY